MPRHPHGNDQCIGCKFYAPRGGLDLAEVGECIRYAPMPVPGQPQPVVEWPLVQPGDWCGDWLRAPGGGN